MDYVDFLVTTFLTQSKLLTNGKRKCFEWKRIEKLQIKIEVAKLSKCKNPSFVNMDLTCMFLKATTAIHQIFLVLFDVMSDFALLPQGDALSSF